MFSISQSAKDHNSPNKISKIPGFKFWHVDQICRWRFYRHVLKIVDSDYSLVISVRLSVCTSVCMEQLSSYWTDLHKILYFSILQKSVENVQVSLKSDKNNGHITWPLYNYGHLAQFFLEWEIFQTKVVQKIKIYFVFYNYFPKIVAFMS